MKKLFIIVLLLVCFSVSFAQNVKKSGFKLQQINAGFIFIPQVTNVASFDFNKMEIATPLLSNINFITTKTYHNLCYAWGANALVMVNGWIYHPEGKQDLYLVTSKNFSSPGGDILLAWETQLANGNAWGAIEVGTSWYKPDELIINLSLTIPFQTTIWKRGK